MPRRSKCFHLECRMAKADGNKAEIMIYSSISNYKYDDDDPTVTSRDFDKELKALGDVDEITIRINSPGGAVNEAVAIRTALMKHKARKIIDIEGSCDSAATLIACLPGAYVRMAKGSDYMIHRCSWIAWGHADAMLAAYQSMINTDNDMADIYAERTGKTREELLALMAAETWFTAETAKEAGFVDEVISASKTEDDEPIAACAMDAETLDVMRECYANVPDHPVAEKQKERPAAPQFPFGWKAEPLDEKSTGNTVRTELTAVAAGNSSENMANSQETKEETHMELKDATAEAIQQENPAAAGEIAKQAVEAERNRRKAILTLKPKGAKWDKMAEDAIANGDSEADFLRAIIAEREKTGEEYLENRRAETKPTENIGAGDAGDHDSDYKEAVNKAAKEIAELAATMGSGTVELA